MSKILQWEPEKSRLWGNATIANISHLRDDLTKLSDWIQSKADSAALGSKADVKKVVQLEENLAAIRRLLDSFKQEVESASSALRQQLQELEHWAKSGEIERHLQELCDHQMKLMDDLATRNQEVLGKLSAESRNSRDAAESLLAQCRVIHEGLLQLDAQAREFIGQSLKSTEIHVAESSGHVDQVKNAVELTGSFRIECEEIAQSLRSKADELTSSWRTVSQALTECSSKIEPSLAKVAGYAQSAQQSFESTRAAAQHNQQLHDSFKAEYGAASERMATLLRETEAQANAALQNGNLAAAASDLSGAMKSECEKLSRSLEATARDFETRLQSEQDQMAQRLAALDHMLELAGTPRVQSQVDSTQVEAIQVRLAEIESKLSAIAATFEKQTRETKCARDEAEALAREMNRHVVSIQLDNTSLWRRVKWLVMGSRSR